MKNNKKRNLLEELGWKDLRTNFAEAVGYEDPFDTFKNRKTPSAKERLEAKIAARKARRKERSNILSSTYALPLRLTITTSQGKELFVLGSSLDSRNTESMTAKQLYDYGWQWFLPQADMYLPLLSVAKNITTFQELKHFTWQDIIDYAEIRKWDINLRSGGSADWKAIDEGAKGYFLVTVDGKPYWADAIGQIPFAIDVFRDKVEEEGKVGEAIRYTVETGKTFGDGNFLFPTRDDTNSYDNYMVLRGAIWASKRFKPKPPTYWGQGYTTEKTDYSPKKLADYITEFGAKKYGLKK